MKNLFKLNRRDCVGLACWLLISVLIGLLALPVMIGRSVQALSFDKVRVGGRGKIFTCHYPRKHY